MTVANHSDRNQATEGHFDYGAILNGDTLSASVKDDRQSPAKWVAPESLQFVLGDTAKNKLPGGMENIGKAGDEVYLIGATQQPGVPWLGWNTQNPELVKNLDGPVTMSLDGFNGPGKMSVFLSGNFGASGQKVFDSESKGSFKVPANTHQHGNWVFTKPGIYDATVTFTAKLKNGKTVKATSTLNFKVGNGVAEQGAGGKADSKSQGKTQAPEKQPEKKADGAHGSIDHASGIVTRPDGTKVRIVGKTSDGADCTLSPDELASAQQASSEGKLAYTGAKVSVIAGSAALLLAAGVLTLYVARRRKNNA